MGNKKSKKSKIQKTKKKITKKSKGGVFELNIPAMMPTFLNACRDPRAHVLGEGEFGKVVKYKCNNDDEDTLALKLIKHKDGGKVEKEINFMRMLQGYPFLNLLAGDLPDGASQVGSDQYLIPMKLISSNIPHPNRFLTYLTSLFDVIGIGLVHYNLSNRSEYYKFIFCILLQLISSLTYCHKKKIFHRDLKLKNILVNKEGYVILADFGLSDLLPEGCNIDGACKQIVTGSISDDQSLKLSTISCGSSVTKGTPIYLSPRQISFNGEIIYDEALACEDEKGDYWALLISLVELVTMKSPQNIDDVFTTIKQIDDSDYFKFYLHHIIENYMQHVNTDNVRNLFLQNLIVVDENDSTRPFNNACYELINYVTITDDCEKDKLVKLFDESCNKGFLGNFNFNDYLLTIENIQKHQPTNENPDSRITFSSPRTTERLSTIFESHGSHESFDLSSFLQKSSHSNSPPPVPSASDLPPPVPSASDSPSLTRILEIPDLEGIDDEATRLLKTVKYNISLLKEKEGKTQIEDLRLEMLQVLLEKIKI